MLIATENRELADQLGIVEHVILWPNRTRQILQWHMFRKQLMPHTVYYCKAPQRKAAKRSKRSD